MNAEKRRPRLCGLLFSSKLVLRRCLTLPHTLVCSTISAVRLSFRVRNGAGRFPDAITTAKNIGGTRCVHSVVFCVVLFVWTRVIECSFVFTSVDNECLLFVLPGLLARECV